VVQVGNSRLEQAAWTSDPRDLNVHKSRPSSKVVQVGNSRLERAAWTSDPTDLNVHKGQSKLGVAKAAPFLFIKRKPPPMVEDWMGSTQYKRNLRAWATQWVKNGGYSGR
jgi:hypothetical protein